MARTRSSTDEIGSWRTALGRRADDPTVVAAVIRAECLLFSALYYGAMAVGQLDRLLVGEWEPVAAIAGLFVLTVANAVAVAWAVWRAFDLTGTWSYWRGAGAGLAVGLVSHLTLGSVVAVYGLGSGPPAARTVQEVAVAVPLFAVYTVLFTAGIPILLSVGTGLRLTYYRRQVAETG